jgi:hypothetical protein
MRVTYDKEMREKSKNENTGLVTIDIVQANGSRSTVQLHVNEKEVRYAYRAFNHIVDLVHRPR